jgi:hypothetical protein
MDDETMCFPRRSRTLTAALVVCVLFMPACMFRALRKNIEEFERFAVINGTVEADVPEGGMTVAVLLRSDTGEAVDSFALGRRGRYFFRVPAGTYFVAAFVDADRDFRYDPTTERGVWYGAPDPIRLAEGQTVDKVDVSVNAKKAIVMDRPLTAPELGRRGMHDLPDVNVGTLATVDDPRFSSENGKLGMWQPVDFALRGLPGIYFIEPYDPEKIPVLFVHGITGHPGEFAYLIEHLDHTRFQPWLLYYPSGGRLDLLGRVAIRWLGAVAARYPIRRFLIVAHSMGGLVSRSLINQWVESVGERRAVTLDAFITISTPWGGHAAAAAGVEHAPEVVPSWYDMGPGSDFLKGVFKTNLPPECRYYLLFGYEGGSALVGGVNDGVVAVSSELAAEAQEQAAKVYGFPESHVSILRSKDVADRLNRILAEVGY